MQQIQNWHALTHEQIQEVLKSKKNFCPNVLPEPKSRSIWSIFLHQFLSPLIYLLIAAAVIALIIGEAKDSIVILVVVFLNAIIGAIQEGRAEQSLRALRKLSKVKSRIIRSNSEIIIEAADIKPGDILVLSAGDMISADARLIEVSSLFTAEAALTGESLPVEKNINKLAEPTLLADRKNMVYASTHVTSGRGKALVVATGIENEIGKIAKLATATEQPKTHLELRIQQFGKQLVYASIIIFVLVIAIGLLRGISFVKVFMIAISQMVSLVPEGLPVAMTIALAVGVQRMAKRKTVVRKLSAVEALGSTTVICTDKTGTLTKNEMTVTETFIVSDAKREDFYHAAILCNDAHLKDKQTVFGDPTETALLKMSLESHFNVSEIQTNIKRLAENPFNSESKMMATEHVINGKNIIYIKGAPEAVFKLCCNNPALEQAKIKTGQMADAALRTLALAIVKDASIDAKQDYKNLAGKVELLGLVGLLDPPRSEVAASISECKNAGIRPVMITGDHKSTGLAIAKVLGMSQSSDQAIDGHELEALTDEELLNKIDHVSVFARVHPEQKLRIVKAFQNKGHIVAMTGDGVNDAPALVSANVGVAMGITGTEVAKEASKIIITDDNFSTIVAAIKEGRLVYQNIKKLLLFLFVTSIDEVLVLFLALIAGYPPPLAAVQILWINLVTEGALTVNLIMEPAEGNEMRRPPIAPHEPLFDSSLVSRIPLMVIASVVSTFGWYWYRLKTNIPIMQVQTETFTVLAVCQWFNVLNCRSQLKSVFTFDILKNPWLLTGLILANLLHFSVIYWQPLSQFFHMVPISTSVFIEIGFVASLVLWVEEIRKFFIRKRRVLTDDYF